MESGPSDRGRERVSSIIPPGFAAVFPFSHFNRVQSQCLTAFTTNNNLIVSAPTGSGKTVLFEMAICREFSQRPSAPDVVGKCVYLSPIRALCTEKAAEWTSKFEPLGINVCTLSGDEFKPGGVSQPSLMNADIILCTPEKLDSVTRNDTGTLSQSLVATVSLLCIDEVHHLSDSRGAALEAVVARMFLCSDELKKNVSLEKSQMPAAHLRVLAASATVPNLPEIASWLRVQDNEYCKTFSDSYRAVPLEHKVLGYTVKNQWKLNDYLASRCYQVVMLYSSKKSSLVFCPSRKTCFSAAKQFIEDMHKKGPATTVHHGNALTESLTFPERSQLLDMASRCSDKTNADLIRHGIAVHHAAVSDEDRELIEELFRERLIRVLFATTTLSMGVSLPARLVVILGTTVYQHGKMVEIDHNMVIQMMGRAGRPQYDTKGVAVVMTAMKNVQLYESLCRGKHDLVTSQLEPKLAEHFNAEISRGTINSMAEAVLWLKSTFLYAQKKNTMRPQALEKATQEVTHNILTALAECELIEYDLDFSRIKPMNASRLMARFYVSFASMRLFASEADEATSAADLLRIVARSTELTESFFLRRSEKKKLNEISLLLRHPLRGKVNSVEEKAYLLLQCHLAVNGSELVAGDFNLAAEMRTLGHSGKRLAVALARYLLERERTAPFTSAMAGLEIARAIEAGVWGNGGGVICQLKGIGPQAAKKLIGGGVSSFCSLARMDARIIEQLLNKNVPFGNELQRQLETVPRLQLCVEQVPANQEAALRNNKVAMVFRVTVSRKSWSEKNEGLLNSSHPMFLLIGSHSKPIEVFEKFTLHGREEHVIIATIVVARKRSSRWIDFMVGPENFVGCDSCHRIHVPGTAQPNELAAVETETGGPESDDLQRRDGLYLAGPEHNLRCEKRRNQAAMGTSGHADRISKACKHTCKDKSRCKHICCFIRMAKPGAHSRETALKEPRSQTGGDDDEKGHARDETLHNLETMREKARPLTSSLPLKRLRENSEPQQSFAGTRLEAFFRQESNENERAPTSRKGERQANEMPREDSYDAIFSLLLERQEEKPGNSRNVSERFCLEKHLEETDDAAFLDLTMPDVDSSFP